MPGQTRRSPPGAVGWSMLFKSLSAVSTASSEIWYHTLGSRSVAGSRVDILEAGGFVAIGKARNGLKQEQKLRGEGSKRVDRWSGYGTRTKELRLNRVGLNYSTNFTNESTQQDYLWEYTRLIDLCLLCSAAILSKDWIMNGCQVFDVEFKVGNHAVSLVPFISVPHSKAQ